MSVYRTPALPLDRTPHVRTVVTRSLIRDVPVSDVPAWACAWPHMWCLDCDACHTCGKTSEYILAAGTTL